MRNIWKSSFRIKGHQIQERTTWARILLEHTMEATPTTHHLEADKSMIPGNSWIQILNKWPTANKSCMAWLPKRSCQLDSKYKEASSKANSKKTWILIRQGLCETVRWQGKWWILIVWCQVETSLLIIPVAFGHSATSTLSPNIKFQKMQSSNLKLPSEATITNIQSSKSRPSRRTMGEVVPTETQQIMAQRPKKYSILRAAYSTTAPWPKQLMKSDPKCGSAIQISMSMVHSSTCSSHQRRPQLPK